jgi:MFS family permease
MNSNTKPSGYRWAILGAGILILFVLMVEMFAFPVLMPMIGEDLKLDIAQLGFVWGMWTFGGVFIAIIGGMFVDRAGIRIAIFTFAMVCAIAMGLRGIANSEAFLAALMFIAGGTAACVLGNVPKALFIWFPPQQVAMANGLYMGIATLGMAVGAAISATLVAPALGGWRNTLILYGAISVVTSFVWLILAREPTRDGTAFRVPMGEALRAAIHSRDVWFCAIAAFGTFGLNMGFTGYLPSFLQGTGWEMTAASTALMVFLLASIITSIVIPVISDRVGIRKNFFITSGLVFSIAVILMTITQTPMAVWILVAIVGLGYGALVPVLNSIIPEIKGIGAMYAGTTISVSIMLGGIGGFLFSAVGMNMATTAPHSPFIFGGIVFIVTLIPFFFIKETGKRKTVSTKVKEAV